MSGAIVDSLLTSARSAAARKRGAHLTGIRYIETRAGRLRTLDSGGTGPVLMLTPDGPCVLEHYQSLVRQFARDFRVVCFDMPGFGFSFPSREYRFGVAETADAIVELLDALAVPKATLAFTCGNGLFAMNLAKRYPQRVSHLVLGQVPSSSAMHEWVADNIPKPVRIPFFGQLVTAMKAERLATIWYDRSLPRHSEHKASIMARAHQALASGGCFSLASLVQGVHGSHEGEFSGVQCPTLTIHGDSDFSHRHTDFGSIKDLIPRAQVATFAGCGHFPDLERESAYVACVRKFVLTVLHI